MFDHDRSLKTHVRDLRTRVCGHDESSKTCSLDLGTHVCKHDESSATRIHDLDSSKTHVHHLRTCNRTCSRHRTSICTHSSYPPLLP